ncbi:hypothetical protein B5M42_017835 [Paenibacillus athensensis]|uniref:Uncharacterized protein n=2 Tax=Paenibacillus athensensis TaxID=1967502 RepID=A0A4Y8Q2G9_9BACL|nr:hypothetical protein [Paenibacillus athensensis]
MNGISYVIFALMIIGLLRSWATIFIPILVLGLIYLLYKYPPNRWQLSSLFKGSSPGDKRRRKNGKFRVINGNKGNDPDDFPKYH